MQRAQRGPGSRGPPLVCLPFPPARWALPRSVTSADTENLGRQVCKGWERGHSKEAEALAQQQADSLFMCELIADTPHVLRTPVTGTNGPAEALPGLEQ